MRGSVLGAGVLLAVSLYLGGTVGASATCNPRPLAQLQRTINSFKIYPPGLLDQFPKGETAMASIIAIAVSGDTTTLNPALDLLKLANPSQRRAVGQGLGTAARMCEQNREPLLALRLETELRKRNDREALASFQLAHNPIAAPSAVVPQQPSRSPDLIGRGSIGDPSQSVFKDRSVSNPLIPLGPVQSVKRAN